MNISTNVLNELNANKQLAKFFKMFVVKFTEFKGLNFVGLYDYKCRHCGNEYPYEIYCGVNAESFVRLPTIQNRFMFYDYNCYLIEKDKCFDISKFWQAFCEIELSGEMLKKWQLGKESLKTSPKNIKK